MYPGGMNWRTTRFTLCGLLCLALSPTLARAQYDPPPHPIFDEDAVHTIRLRFHQPDWWDQLVSNFEGLEDPLYMEAEFDWEDIHFDEIGVRFKGRGSYTGYPGFKKSFKLKFDEYHDEQSVYGLDKLNLNNGHRDPTFVRERCFYEQATAMGLPACRTNYAAFYINDVYWGLYIIIEQVDKEFLESRFGSSEDGNLWKGDPRGSFEYHGPDESAYYPYYELKTNETANDWSALVEMIDALNNTPSTTLAATMHDLIDINSAMVFLATNTLTGNLDSYSNTNHNHYAYHRDSDGRFVHMEWDANQAWGAFPDDPQLLALMRRPFGGTRNPPATHPLSHRLWNLPVIESLFHSHIRRSLHRGAEPSVLLARMAELRDLVRPYVHADSNMVFTPADFEEGMDRETADATPKLIPRLSRVVIRRHHDLQEKLGPFSGREDLALNELMAKNGSTLSDNAGDFDDWVEIVNRGDQAISLQGISLTDYPGEPAAYTFPNVMLQPGSHYLVWADDEVGEGADHAPFKLSANGESVFLFDGTELLDTTTWGGLEEDEAYGRFPEGVGPWISDLIPTPGAPNMRPVGDGSLFINEFLAKNETGITDEAGEFEDWIEIYNPSGTSVDLDGYSLTDDLTDLQQWQFPPTTLPAGGYLIVWCDGDPGDGPLHSNFKLGASGEEIGLSGPVSAGSPLIDSYIFGPQSADISEGRVTDGAAVWTFFHAPTPGAANSPPLHQPLIYGIGKLSSRTEVPLLSPHNDPSASGGNFELTVVQAVPNQAGMLFYGPGRAELPFYSGRLWVKDPFTRLAIQPLDANGTTTYSIPISANEIGTLRCFQSWFRDFAHSDGTAVGLSNGVEVVFWP
jgi:hypothetical protein